MAAERYSETPSPPSPLLPPPPNRQGEQEISWGCTTAMWSLGFLWRSRSKLGGGVRSIFDQFWDGQAMAYSTKQVKSADVSVADWDSPPPPNITCEHEWFLFHSLWLIRSIMVQISVCLSTALFEMPASQAVLEKAVLAKIRNAMTPLKSNGWVPFWRGGAPAACCLSSCPGSRDAFLFTLQASCAVSRMCACLSSSQPRPSQPQGHQGWKK